MARFDVYANPGLHAETTPYLLSVQSDLLNGLDSCMVIPLRRLDRFAKVKLPTQLTPVVSIEGHDFMVETPKMGAVPQRILKSPVCTLVAHQAEITAAMDFLFHGY